MKSSSYVINRLALGTVQFGIPYGVANQHGQVTRDEAAAILTRASAAGIDTLDTAVAYGSAEQCLGDIGVRGWRIISKLPGLPADEKDVAGWVENTFAESLARLKVDKIEGLLLHRPTDLLGPQGDLLYQALAQLKSRGLVRKIGLSIYTADELATICPRYAVDLIQGPFNIFDRRLIETGWLERLQQNGIEVHARSIFLQGLLLMPPSARPAKFLRWQVLWDRWDAWLSESNLTPLAACLRHALNHPGINRVIVGVDSLVQFEEIIQGAEGDLPPLAGNLYSNDPDLINPAQWATA